ncbi:MAG: EAL domain-containing protein [Gammaproteobacteria bacterium]|nr:EAL domain-containing protein [Gammaproteobacteria bacterium]
MVAIAKRLVPAHKISLLQREHFKATHDPVTGLLNQIALDEHIEQQLMVSARYDKSFALLMVELDPYQEFVGINSKITTNAVLLDFAKRIKCCVRRTDTVARVESNVFSILLPDIQNFRNVVKVVENINHQLLDPFLVKDAQYVVNAVIGIEVFPNKEKTHKSFSENAFIAMCRAKNITGRNYVFYDDDLDQSVCRRISLENSIREAIEQQEYDIHYLPVNSIRGNELSYVQADVAWHSGQLRDMDPDTINEYIETMELSKLFGDIQLSMICQKLTHWEHDIEFGNKPVLLALGDSRLNDQQTPSRYKKIVTAAGVAPERIGLVIKESQILQDIEFAQHQIRAFKQEGFKVIIDRFCCGLAYLGKFSPGMVDMIRLDGEIVSRLDERIEWLCVVEGLIRIARQLNIQTIVDGIDNDFQYQTLLNVSADYWQGDYVFILSNGMETPVAGNKSTR